jgi:hypothetical protein
MRTITSAILALSAFAFPTTSVDAATAAPKKSYASCAQLATQRGMIGGAGGGGSNYDARRFFIGRCMAGKQN